MLCTLLTCCFQVASPVANVSISPQPSDGKFQSGSVSSPAEESGETISENFWDKPEFVVSI